MASSSVQAPASMQSQDSQPRSAQSSAASHHTSSYLAGAFSLSRGQSEATEAPIPPVERIETPSGSNATLSHYQSSDFSDLDDDPFFGADFNHIDPATPSFLDDATWGQTAFPPNGFSISDPQNEPMEPMEPMDTPSYLLTPAHTASVHTTPPPRSDHKYLGAIVAADRLPESISPQQLEKTYTPTSVVVNAFAIASSLSSSNRTSEDSLAPALAPIHSQSPRVTVSVWDKDNDAPVHTVERTLEDSPRTVRGGVHSAGDLISAAHDDSIISAHRNSFDRCQQEPGSRRAGIDPRNRPSDEVRSINEIVAHRATDERNQDVGRWLSHNLDDASAPIGESPEEIQAIEGPRDDDDDIPLGHSTENRYIPGQTYFEGAGGEISDLDREIIASSRNWADPPIIPGIQMGEYGRYQPESSQAAIARFERMCRDNDSILSRSATWGTRRRSFPNIMDAEGVTSGSFLKKLSLSRGSGDKTSRPGSFLRDLRGLVRRASVNQLRKRSRSRSRGHSVNGQDEEALFQQETGQNIKRESTPHLSPPLGSTSSGKKPAPSMNTTLASMGQNIASMWTSHSRSGSVSGVSPTASPRASLGSLKLRSSLRRPRSKSEIPKPSTTAAEMESTSSLVDMWRKTGGPPVAPVSRVNHLHTADEEDDDDDDDDDDELCEGNEMGINPNVIDEITPSVAGFQQHVVKLNPGIGKTHGYLVDRIAHQQMVRYKHLLNAKVKHLDLGANCSCGSSCVALGGLTKYLDQKEDVGELDPLSNGIEYDEGMSTEGAINQESFPPDIPMPPAQYLPAEFECQLCYEKKKVQKPSDWTKHVHEDVQPFTCTWDKCRDPKMLKRKADWVRHENEGHRHLEWWTCDVDDCRHTCYRRDNFLQHLVREHKYLEPKVKYKAAMKRAGGMDSTWQKVEQCHVETTARPQDEPCRFCGKVFPTWKKLTVHLAKHMEQISLPVLRLVAAKAKESAADTIVSPVQDPPPQQTIPLPPNPSASSTQFPSEQHVQPPQQNQRAQAQQQLRNSYEGQPGASFQSPNQFVYPVTTPGPYQQHQLHHDQFENTEHNLRQLNLGAGTLHPGLDAKQRVQDMTSSQTNGYLSCNNGGNNFMNMPESNDVEPFPQPSMNALGLHNVGDVHIGVQLSGHMGYDPTMDPSSVNVSPFSGHESLSTYSHSPRLNGSSSFHLGQQQQQQQQQHRYQQHQYQQTPPHQQGTWHEQCLFLQ